MRSTLLKLCLLHLAGNALLLWLGYYWLGVGEGDAAQRQGPHHYRTRGEVKDRGARESQGITQHADDIADSQLTT